MKVVHWTSLLRATFYNVELIESLCVWTVSHICDGDRTNYGKVHVQQVSRRFSGLCHSCCQPCSGKHSTHGKDMGRAFQARHGGLDRAFQPLHPISSEFMTSSVHQLEPACSKSPAALINFACLLACALFSSLCASHKDLESVPVVHSPW